MTAIETPLSPAKGLLADYATETEVAVALDVHPRTLRAQRARGEGPPFVRIAKAIYYPKLGFRDWLKSIEQRPVRAKRAA
jgi:hypothetical protein